MAHFHRDSRFLEPRDMCELRYCRRVYWICVRNLNFETIFEKFIRGFTIWRIKCLSSTVVGTGQATAGKTYVPFWEKKHTTRVMIKTVVHNAAWQQASVYDRLSPVVYWPSPVLDHKRTMITTRTGPGRPYHLQSDMCDLQHIRPLYIRDTV